MSAPLLYPHRAGEGSALFADDTRGFEEGRQYKWGNLWLDSVTSIISQGVPKGEAIIKWAAREAAHYAVANLARLADMPFDLAEKEIKEEPFRRRDDAAEVGGNVHDYAEALVLGIPTPELTEQEAAKAKLFDRFLADYRPEFEAAECWIYSLGRRYAGRFDAIFTVDGVKYLCDWKTGKRTYPEVGLQLAALRNAEFVGLADGTEVAMPPVDACAVLHIGAKSYSFKRVRAEDVEYRTFLYAAEIAKWRKDANAVVIGAPILPASAIPPRPDAPVSVASMLD